MITEDELVDAIRALPVPAGGVTFRDDLRDLLEQRRRRRRWPVLVSAAAVALAVVTTGLVVSGKHEDPLTVAAITPSVAHALADLNSFSVTVERVATESYGDGRPTTTRFRGDLVLLATGDYWLENLEPSAPGTVRWASFDSSTGTMRGEAVAPDGSPRYDLVVGQTSGGTGLAIVLGGDPVLLGDSVQRLRESGEVPVEEVQVDGRSAWRYVDHTRMTHDGGVQEARSEVWVDRTTGLPLRVEDWVRWPDGERESVTTFKDLQAPARMPAAYPGNVPSDVVPSGDPDAVTQLTLSDAVARFGDRVLVPATPTGYEAGAITLNTGPASVYDDDTSSEGRFFELIATYRRGFRSASLSQHWTVIETSTPASASAAGTPTAAPTFERLVDGEWVHVQEPAPARRVVLRAGALKGETATIENGVAFVDRGAVSITAHGDDPDVLVALLESLERQ